MMRRQKKGFTLVEISLATAFIAVLLLMITTITMSMAAIFQKGTALRNINATGRDLIDDFDRTITSAPLKRINEEEGGEIDKSLYFRERTGEANIIRQSADDPQREEPHSATVQYSGVFCSGKYSYIWNTGYILDPQGRYQPENKSRPTQFKYANGSVPAEGDTDFRLIKFSDPNRVACANAFINEGDVDIEAKELTLEAPPEELLSSTDGQVQLALYELTMFAVVQDPLSLRSFYSGTFILATLTGDVDVKAAGDYCNPANHQSLSGDFNYCAVNKFNFAAQASGQADGE